MASTSAKFGFIKGSPIIDVAELPNPVTKSAINPTGTISKVYFNTSLTAEEVNAIIDSVLGDVSSGTQKLALVCCDGMLTEDGTTFTNSIGVAKMNTGTDYAYVISVYDNASSVDCYMYMTAYGFNGWLDSSVGVLNNNPYTFSNPFTSVSSVVTPDTQETIQVGEYNELLKDLVYVEEVNENAVNTKALYRLPDGTLWHYNGQWNAVGSGEEGGSVADITLPETFFENLTGQVSDEDAEKIVNADIITIRALNESVSIYAHKICNMDGNILLISSNDESLILMSFNYENKVLSMYKELNFTPHKFLNSETNYFTQANPLYKKLVIDSATGVATLTEQNGSVSLTGGLHDKYSDGVVNSNQALFETQFIITAIQNLCTYIATLEARIKALEEA